MLKRYAEKQSEEQKENKNSGSYIISPTKFWAFSPPKPLINPATTQILVSPPSPKPPDLSLEPHNPPSKPVDMILE